MKTFIKISSFVCVLTLLSNQAHAVIIDFTTGGTTIKPNTKPLNQPPTGLGNDTVDISGVSSSVNLTANGAAQTVLINNLKWTYFNSAITTTKLNFAQNITISSIPPGATGTQSLIQGAMLAVTKTKAGDDQTLSFLTANAIDFIWSDGVSDYDLSITALGNSFGPVQSSTVFDPSPQTVHSHTGPSVTGELDATFQLTSAPASGGIPISGDVIPETSTYIAGVLLIIPFGISIFRVLRKRRTDSHGH